MQGRVSEGGGLTPVEAWPRRLLAMMMACLESRATWLMSLDQTMYLMKGVLKSAVAVLCCTSNRVTCRATNLAQTTSMTLPCPNAGNLAKMHTASRSARAWTSWMRAVRKRQECQGP